MGVESGLKIGHEMTRADAEREFVAMRAKQMHSALEAEASSLGDHDLGRRLTEMNDEAHNGEGYTLFVVSEHPDNGNY